MTVVVTHPPKIVNHALVIVRVKTAAKSSVMIAVTMRNLVMVNAMGRGFVQSG